MDQLRLTVPPQTSDSLRFARVVDLLGKSQKRTEEDRMIRPSEIRSARTFIRHIQKQNSFFRVILELLEVLGLLRCAALDFKELDLVRSEGLRNFLHEVRELHED